MGTQLCSQHKNLSSRGEESTPFDTCDPLSNRETSCPEDELILQEFDNPSRNLLDKGFLNTSISASNKKLQQSHLICQNMEKRRQNETHRKDHLTSIYRIESSQLSIGKNQWDQVFEPQDYQQSSQNSIPEKKDEIRPRKATIQSRIQEQENSLQKQKNEESQTIIKQISGFILSSKKIFDPVPVTKQDFIKFRKEQIEKHYSFVQKIGEGTFGNVFKVFHKSSKEYRAIKILKKSAISKADTGKIMREIDILKKLDHPHILKIYQVFFYQTNYYIVTQHCQGGTLSKFLYNQNAPDLLKIREIALQLMSALSYIHKKGYIHRDIKLDNILLKRKIENNFEEIDIRLIDFGLAKEIKGKRLKDKQKIGTHTYMSPEVIEGIYSSKCDMWSIGIVLFCLITGKNPFKARSKDQTFQKIKKDHLTLKSQIWKDIDISVKQVILGLLQKDHRLRLSAQQVLSSRWLSGRTQVEKDISVINQVARKLYDYYRGSNFITMIQSYIAYTTTQQKDLKQYSNYFSLLDENKDGFIQKKELKKIFQLSSNIFSEQQLDYILEKIESQYDEGINFTQFISQVSDRTKLYSNESLTKAFQYLDQDNNGYIQKNELKKIFKKLDGNQVSYIVNQLDQNNDQRISKEQFIHYLRKELVSEER